MPNWCDTEYAAIGPKEQLIKLFNTLRILEDIPYPGLVDNDFGSTWLGNLVSYLGEDPQTIGRCRGFWHGLVLEDNKLTFFTTTAWCEADDTRKLIERRFPEVKLYYMSEEFGCDYWVTNDITGKYFSDRYYIQGDQKESCWFENLSSLVVFAEEYSHTTGLNTYEDCVNAIRTVAQSYSDYPYIQAVTIQD